jgi:hypothetical protein
VRAVSYIAGELTLPELDEADPSGYRRANVKQADSMLYVSPEA